MSARTTIIPPIAPYHAPAASPGRGAEPRWPPWLTAAVAGVLSTLLWLMLVAAAFRLLG
ncbi:MAG: hypothetical protein ACOCYE_09380 [Pseudomonadota bacterium]